MVKGKRYTKAWFKGKQTAKTAEVKRREDVEKKQELEATGDMALLELLNLRLDYLLDRAYSESHYKKTTLAAQPKLRPYLWVLRETLARSIEVHRLKWKRVNFEERYVELKTYKNKNREPVLRQVPMTDQLYDVLWELFKDRDPDKEWVFWHRYYNAETRRMEEGPYKGGRYKMLQTTCRRAGVDHYTFHRFRASGASVMDNSGALFPGIQHILGHADRRSTEIYLEKLRDVERDAMDVYEKESRKNDDKVA